MDFLTVERASDSPLVEGIWRTEAVFADTFISQAEQHWEMVFTKQYDKTTLSVRGPETKPKIAAVPVEAEFFGIIFKIGAFLPDMPVSSLVNKEIHIPASTRTFQLLNDTWEVPTFDNADVFIGRLMRQELLAFDPVVEGVLKNEPQDMSLRTVQRRFLKATGMPYGVLQQIERAKLATSLLEQGVPILDAAFEAGYADQPHLTRSLKRFMGQTPAQIADIIKSE